MQLFTKAYNEVKHIALGRFSLVLHWCFTAVKSKIEPFSYVLHSQNAKVSGGGCG